MKEHRSPNPLVDSRRPRNGAVLHLNPPGFVWRPIEDAASFRIEVSEDQNFGPNRTQSMTIEGRTLIVWPETLRPGNWYWRWCGADGQGNSSSKWSEVFSFEMASEAHDLGDISSEAVFPRIPREHPRHLLSADGLDDLRQRCRTGQRDEWQRHKRLAEQRLDENFQMTEPPFLPNRAENHDEWGRVWKDAMNHSRQYGQDTQLFALVYCIERDERFGRAAAERLLEFARWDPDGSTSIPHNDEPHMSIINLGPRALDWAWDCMTEAERKTVIDALVARGERNLQLLIDQDYGVIGSSSHSGRMLGFLGEMSLVLAHEAPEAKKWFDFVVPATVAMYPWWGDDAGGWSEGAAYSTAYVYLFLHFIYSLRQATGIDLYQKPFFRNHGLWRMMVAAPNAKVCPFGDGGQNGQGIVASSWGIQRHLGRVYGDARFLIHAEQIAATQSEPLVECRGLYAPLSFLTETSPPSDEVLPKSMACLFDDIGWLIIRTNLQEPSEDIRFMMRSSPYGADSHSHADHNSFAIEAFGESLAIPSGIYNLYGSAHHHGWTRHTRAQNALTFDGAGQIIRSENTVGEFLDFHTDDFVTYAEAEAGVAYGERVRSARRMVLCLDWKIFVLVDQIELTWPAMWTWHLHSANPITFDGEGRRGTCRVREAALDLQFCYRKDLRWRIWDGFDIQPFDHEGNFPESSASHHLDVYSEQPVSRDQIVTVMVPRKSDQPETKVIPLRGQNVEGAKIELDGCTYVALASSSGTNWTCDEWSDDARIVVRKLDDSGTEVRRFNPDDPKR